MKRTRQARTIVWDLLGEKPVTLSLSYSPAERVWYDSDYGCKMLTIGLSHVPRWNDRVVICEHTYRVTRVSYKLSPEQKYPFVSAEWVSSTRSSEDELRELQESVLCRDCRVDAIEDGMFMVHNHIWDAAVPEGRATLLCLKCFERRLGRPVDLADLTDALINWDLRKQLGETPALHDASAPTPSLSSS